MERFEKRAGGGERLSGLPEWLSDALLARGVDTPEKARAFLKPEMSHVLDPFLLPGMREAVAAIKAARARGLRAVVYGDYDVDGVCAAAILKGALRAYGLSAAVYIPDRHEEGYGLNEAAVRRIAERAGLLVTVDCGITAREEVALAKALGMTVVITDHHTPPDLLPEADAVIDPCLAPYPFPSLCGAGVAYKVCLALLGEAAAADCLDLAALATVADMAPLLNENRALVHFGLKALQNTRRPGLRALMRVAGFDGEMTSEHIAFGLAPRLNAGGRLSSAMTALTLLETGDEAEAQRLALELEALNQKRRALEKEVEQDALKRLEAFDLTRDAAIVIMGEGYESGVVGLAAGRIADAYGYPTVILSRQGELAVGSARSAGSVDLYAALSACADLFERFGGHKQAAGMTLRADNVPALRQRLSDAVRAQLNGRLPEAVRYFDAELPLPQVSRETFSRLSLLEPCGVGNPSPVFLVRNAQVLCARRVGAAGAHLKLTLGDAGETRGGIAFGKGALAERMTGRADALYAVSENAFNGRVSYECRVTALKPDPAAAMTDKKTERETLLQDLCGFEQNNIQFPLPILGEQAVEALLRPGCGTLLLCRAAETARRMAEVFPGLDFFSGALSDPRAPSGIAVNAPRALMRAPYKAVVLCDGALGGFEGAALQTSFPDAEIFRLPLTDALRALLRETAPTVEKMRALYALLKKGGADRLDLLAGAAGLNEEETLACLMVMAELGLLTFAREPFACALLPFSRRDPKESPLFCRFMAALTI